MKYLASTRPWVLGRRMSAQDLEANLEFVNRYTEAGTFGCVLAMAGGGRLVRKKPCERFSQSRQTCPRVHGT